MRHDDRYSDEEDYDLWDDELDLDSGDSQPGLSESPGLQYVPDSSYSPYQDYDIPPAGRDDDGHDGDDSNRDNEEEDYYSDPEPSKRTKPRLGFFRKKAEDDEEEEDAEDDDGDEGNDYYDSDSESRPKRPKRPKAPRLDPEDPEYWITEEDSPLSGIIHKPGKKWKWQLGAAIALTVAILFAWIWFFRPYSDNAVKYGYIKHMERRGTLIKTFEGSMIPYKELGDPNPFYFEEIGFSVKNDSLAAVMKRMMLGCVPVRIEYEMYHAPLPWKGEEKMIVIKADTADPKKILPPEYR